MNNISILLVRREKMPPERQKELFKNEEPRRRRVEGAWGGKLVRSVSTLTLNRDIEENDLVH